MSQLLTQLGFLGTILQKKEDRARKLLEVSKSMDLSFIVYQVSWTNHFIDDRHVEQPNTSSIMIFLPSHETLSIVISSA